MHYMVLHFKDMYIAAFIIARVQLVSSAKTCTSTYQSLTPMDDPGVHCDYHHLPLKRTQNVMKQSKCVSFI